MKSLYTPEGWLDVPAILATGLPFLFVVGGRGTGKTFGALKYAWERSTAGTRFLLLRRTLTQVEIINKPEYSPFKAICETTGWQIVSKPLSKYSAGFYAATEAEENVLKASGPPVGYTAALSTFSNMRSQDMSDVDLVIYDEFIPQPQERPMKDEAGALWNAYETINRNRELLGRPPCQLLCLANANDLGNPVFLDLGLVRRAEKMREKGTEWWQDSHKGIGMAILRGSPISDQKRETALYRLLDDTEYTRMALSNDFSAEERSSSGTVPLRELVPIVRVGEICIYRMKAGGYYVSGHVSGSPPTYGAGPKELQRFRTRYQYLWLAFMQNRITFEEYACEICFCNYFNL